MGLHKLATERQIPYCMWHLRAGGVKPVSFSHTASSHGAENRTVVTQGLEQWGGGWGKLTKGSKKSWCDYDCT